jgi:hypothetical protein
MSNEKMPAIIIFNAGQINREQYQTLQLVEHCEFLYRRTGNPLHALNALWALMVPRVPFPPNGTIDEAAAYAAPPLPWLEPVEGPSRDGHAGAAYKLELPEWLAEYLWRFVRSAGNLMDGRDYDQPPQIVPTWLPAEGAKETIERTIAENGRRKTQKDTEFLRALGIEPQRGTNAVEQFQMDVDAFSQVDAEAARAWLDQMERQPGAWMRPILDAVATPPIAKMPKDLTDAEAGTVKRARKRVAKLEGWDAKGAPSAVPPNNVLEPDSGEK